MDNLWLTAKYVSFVGGVQETEDIKLVISRLMKALGQESAILEDQGAKEPTGATLPPQKK